VHDTLWASRDQPDATRNGGLPSVPAPEIRLARVRMLTHWNDRAQRTQEEVLAGHIAYSYGPFPEEGPVETEVSEVTTESYQAEEGAAPVE